MWEIRPQEIPEGIDPRVFAALSGAMPSLVQEVHAQPALPELREWAEHAVVPGTTRDCLLAALWLLEGNLDQAHRLCQDVPTVLGSAWHAVVHRQEGDFWNSKYWWRRVGSHPVIAELEYGDPFAFVDRCEKARGTGSAAEGECRRLQLAEWHVLFEYCYRHATAAQ